MEDAHEAELREHYARGEERDRLTAGHGLLEFTRTTEIILRFLPAAPARVADIAGGPGRYAPWLAGLGYSVDHRDRRPLAGVGAYEDGQNQDRNEVHPSNPHSGALVAKCSP